MRIPKHIGIIPDGNRRWAIHHGMTKDRGYAWGISPGMILYNTCKKLGIEEMSFYGFTVDNTKRPSEQRLAFTNACIDAVKELSKEDAELLVVGDTDSPMFPEALLPYITRQTFGAGGMKINFLINYSWEWDLGLRDHKMGMHGEIGPKLKTAEVSRVDLIVRWGGCRRLSGFLPVQSVYSDLYIVDDYWPDFQPEHLMQAIAWYEKQDVTLGG
ncbi:MAG: undecaprenyl diphosphate synthase family protein [Clostridium sp.]